MSKIKSTALSLTILLSAFAYPSYAQNTGGVFGPVVNEGHRSFQYRLAFDPDNANNTTGFAQRLHYQQAINDDFMWRILGQTRKTGASDVDFDFVQGELFWQLGESENYQSGVRFDLRFRDGDRPDQIGVNWMHEFKLKNNWSSRFLLLSTAQFGDNSANGVFLQSRFRFHKTTSFGGVGVESFSNYGNSRDIGSFDEQSHTIGPYLSNNLKNGWSTYFGGQFGVTDPSADAELRFWVTKNL